MFVTNDELDREIWQKHRDGVRFKRIAEDLGVNRVTVWRRLRRLIEANKSPGTSEQVSGAGDPQSQTEGESTPVPEAEGIGRPEEH